MLTTWVYDFSVITRLQNLSDQLGRVSLSEPAGGEKCPVTPGLWTTANGYHMLHLQEFLYLLFLKVLSRNLYQGPQKCYLQFLQFIS